MAKWNEIFKDQEVAAYMSEDGSKILCLEKHYVNHNINGQSFYARVWKMYDANELSVITPETLKHEPQLQ
jgi:hypothetical protein